MATKASHVDNEITEHKSNLNQWIKNVSDLPKTDSCKGVHNRFIRDCQTLVNDMNETPSPSSADLIDFTDRANSLEVQHSQLTDNGE